jgi:hypothetical protein
MLSLTNYIKQPEELKAASVQELQELVERYPYFQAARLLLLQGLYQLQDDRFGVELRKAALFVPDRARLFELIEGDKFKLEPEVRASREPVPSEVLPSADRTQVLIDSFLQQKPEESKPRRPRPVDATTDYMGYLLQMEDAPASPASTPVAPEVNQLTQPSPLSSKMETVTDDDSTTENEAELTPSGMEESDTNVPSEAFFTETLARIYIKQGKYSKAIEIIRRLYLNYPKKSRYFADQIRFLEKLIINEQSNNNN